MKHAFAYLLLLGCLVSLNSCEDKHLEQRTYVANVPEYVSYESMQKAIKVSNPKEITVAGKIYFKDNYLFISDPGKGVHVIDNANPANPIAIAYIEVPGNVDIAINDDMLYVDNYIDLVVIDISSPTEASEVGRLKSAFPEKLPPSDPNFPIAQIDYDKGVVIGFKVEEITEFVEVGPRNSNGFSTMETRQMSGDPSVSFLSTSSTNKGFTSGTGVAGSMAQFAIKGNSLFAVLNQSMFTYDISDETAPTLSGEINLNWEVDTIFTKDDHIFLGTKSGMIIYDVTTPSSPEYVSRISHIRSCDPVVVEGDFAYVTLRNGTSCWGITNELQIIDISDLSNPFMIARHNLNSPSGLGIDNNVLFICDGDEGLRIFDVTDPYDVLQNELTSFSDVIAYDVIPLNDVLMTITDEGLLQYDYSDKNTISLISTINIDK